MAGAATSTVAVVGANRGIGLAFVRSYAASGWRVHACTRAPDAAPELKAVRGDVRIHRLDVTDPAEIAATAAAIDDPLDVYIHNAGIYGPRGVQFGAVDAAAWEEVLRVNTIAPLKCAEAVLPLIERGRMKTMAFLTSRMGSIDDNTSGGAYIYRSSKAALNAVVRSLAIDLAGRGIKAIVLHPGWVKTEMGGPGATLEPDASVAGMRRIIDRLTPAQSGRFWNHDGRELPW